MRALCVVLLLAACHHERTIVRAMDPKCYTPCWEGAGHPGVGTCTVGTWQCDDNGDLTVCKDQGSYSPETCDGLDNDCDGVVDHEIDTCVNGCGTGKRQCVNGEFGECMHVVNRLTTTTPMLITNIFTVTECYSSFDGITAASGGHLYDILASDTQLELWLDGVIRVYLPAVTPQAARCSQLGRNSALAGL